MVAGGAARGRRGARAARRAGGEARARLVVLADEVLAGLDVDGARLVLEQPVAAYGERLLGGGLLLGLGLGLGLGLELGLGFVSSAVACS